MNDNIQDRPIEDRANARREFIENGNRDLPWYNEHLPHERRGIQLGSKLTKLRNHAICALFIQLISTIAGFSLFFARRNRVYLAANFLSLVFLIVGFHGTLKLQKWYIASHFMFTGGVIGVIWLYLVLEGLFQTNSEYLKDEGKMSERTTTILLTLPYLIDLLTGIFTGRLAYHIFKEDDEIERARHHEAEEREPILADEDYSSNSNLCCICMNAPNNMVILTCGHKAVCKECSVRLTNQNIRRCPICMSFISGYNPVY